MTLGPFEINRVYNEECLEAMRSIPRGSVDAVVTDPPWPNCRIDLGWQGKQWWTKVVRQMERVVGAKGKVIIHLNTETDPRLLLSAFRIPFVHLCWMEFIPPRYRGNILNHADVAYQFGFGFLPRGRRVLEQRHRSPSQKFNRHEREITEFPCPRHLPHVQWLIETQVGPGRVVLDPFAGSGTTGVACAVVRADFMGLEVDAGYARIAQERLSAALASVPYREAKIGQRGLFGEV